MYKVIKEAVEVLNLLRRRIGVLTKKIRFSFDNIINLKYKTMTIKIYDQDTNNYIDEIYLTGNNNKKEIEQNIKEYYNLNKIYYSIA
jgi:hypothetical protein